MASGFAGFTIHQDFTENVQRKNKVKDDFQGKPPATKRTALGVITNNQRVQPSRAAKVPAGNENLQAFGCENLEAKSKAFVSSVPSQVFSIHVDEPLPARNVSRPAVNSKSQQSIKPLLVPRPPFQPIESFADDSYCSGEESPMVLDASMHNDSRMQTCTSEQDRMHRILHIPDYTEDIYRHLREMEMRHRPKPQYMKKQPDITASMRSILVDWLVEVAEEYKLHRETLCLAVNYIDRFLSHMSVLRGKLQLVGAASMFLAAKFEEIYPPEVGEFVYITDDTYTKKQVLRMEHLILKVLSFDVACPTVNCFVERFIYNDGADSKTKSLAMYLVEQTLVDADPFLKYTPSSIAAAAVCLANIVMGRLPWSDHMEQVTGYAVNDLSEVLDELHRMFANMPAHPQQSIREKYKTDKYHNVSTLCPPETLPTL